MKAKRILSGLISLAMLSGILTSVPVSAEETVSGKTVFDYKETDETAKTVFDTFIKNLGIQIVGLCNIFSPDIIVIGGGISSQGEALTKPLEDYVNNNMFLKIIGKKIKITSAKFLNNAGFLGARCLFN